MYAYISASQAKVVALSIGQAIVAVALSACSNAPQQKPLEPSQPPTQKIGPLQMEVPSIPPTPVSSPAPAHDPKVAQERLDTFDWTNRQNTRRDIYAGIALDGFKLTLKVKDSWHGLSRDAREVFVRDCFTHWIGLGAVRGISEKPEDYAIEVRHEGSNRLLAQWGSTLGFRPTD